MFKKTFWKILKTGHPKFPFRLIIAKGSETLLDLYVQDRWPGTRGNIFCIRASGRDDLGGTEVEIENVPIVNFSSYGKRITIILDRPTQKRCSFLFLAKEYKSKEGEYEQIFWQTQQGLTQRKTKYKLTYYKTQELTVFIDTAERYAWNFLAKIIKEKLPIGDYAVKDQFGFLAVVERKTFANLMAEFGNLKKFHQHLHELEVCKNSALVVEATYGDFLNAEKIKPYVGQFGAKAIAEIQAAHPKLPVIFAGSRKMAQIWAQNFFAAVSVKNSDYLSDEVRESIAKYGSERGAAFSDDEARRAVFSTMPECFTTRNLVDNVPRLSYLKSSAFLKKLENEGVLNSEKERGRIIWRKVSKERR